MKHRRYKEALELIDRRKLYKIDEAIDLVLKVAKAKFDETIEVAIKLKIDPKKTDQMIRSTIVFPHSLGYTPKILVFTKGENEKIAQTAGATYVGCEDLIEKIEKGWIDFDAVIATPDVMKEVSKLGRILGPKGLMPNPKLGTVTFNLKEIIKEIKLGRIEFKTDKTGIVHVPFGKKSFSSDKLKENFFCIVNVILKNRPPTVKGQYIKSITISSTMSPGIKIDPLSFSKLYKEGEIKT